MAHNLLYAAPHRRMPDSTPRNQHSKKRASRITPPHHRQGNIMGVALIGDKDPTPAWPDLTSGNGHTSLPA